LKRLVYFIVLSILILGCPHTQAIKQTTVSMNGDTLTFNDKDWWDCSEYSFYAYQQLRKKYPTEIYLGFGASCSDSKDWYSHVWVQYEKNGDSYIFDSLREDVVRLPLFKGDDVLKLIEKEQKYRQEGVEADLTITSVPFLRIKTEEGLSYEGLEWND